MDIECNNANILIVDDSINSIKLLSDILEDDYEVLFATSGKKALEITIELAQEAGKLASKFLKGPHDLEYEKTFMPFCLLSKKRYVEGFCVYMQQIINHI